MTQLQALSSTPFDSNQESFSNENQKVTVKGHNLKREPVEMEN